MPLDDEGYMRLALRQGRLGLGRTSPNPPVGAVVVRSGRIVGRGFHRRAGAPHGEIAALRAAGPSARGATLYVTLEPCAHFGRTPPCVDAIRQAGVRRVVVGSRDPNPHVSGGGIEKLRRSGIAVTAGVLEPECSELIAAFRKRVVTGLPWVTLKLAASLDGRIATASGDSRWVTAAPARQLTHRWRNTHDAILVGCETVCRDDPQLTCRLRGGRNPLRVVLDGRLRIPLGARVLSADLAPGTVVVTQRPAPARKAGAVARAGARVMELPGRAGRVSLRALLRALAARGVSSVLVEGGGVVAAAAIRGRVVDRLLLFYAPKLLGGDGRPMIGTLQIGRMSEATALDLRRVRRVGPDLLIEADLRQRETPRKRGSAVVSAPRGRTAS